MVCQTVYPRWKIWHVWRYYDNIGTNNSFHNSLWGYSSLPLTVILFLLWYRKLSLSVFWVFIFKLVNYIMGIQKILPNSESSESAILIHRFGEIIAHSDSMYQVRIYREPERKILTTCIERAYIILQNEEEIIKISREPYCRY